MALNVLDSANKLAGAGNQVGVLQIPKGRDLFYPKASGACRMVILPYVTTCSPYVQPGDMFYIRDYYLYRGLGANQKQACLDYKRTFNEPCAITDALMNYAGDPQRKPRSQRKALFNVWFPQGFGQIKAGEVALFDMPYASFAKLLIEDVKTRSTRAKWEFTKNFADPVEGCYIDLEWVEDSLNGHRFYQASAFDYEPHGGVPADVLEKVLDLDTLFAKMTYDQVQRAFLGYEDDTPAQVEPAVSVGVSAPTSSRKDEPLVTNSFKRGDTLYIGEQEVVFIKETDGVAKVTDADGDPMAVSLSQLTRKPVAAPKATKVEKPVAKTEEKPLAKDAPWDDDSWDKDDAN